MATAVGKPLCSLEETAVQTRVLQRKGRMHQLGNCRCAGAIMFRHAAPPAPQGTTTLRAAPAG
jgi:hypothetical protein